MCGHEQKHALVRLATGTESFLKNFFIKRAFFLVWCSRRMARFFGKRLFDKKDVFQVWRSRGLRRFLKNVFNSDDFARRIKTSLGFPFLIALRVECLHLRLICVALVELKETGAQ